MRACAALKLALYCENTSSNWVVLRRVRHVEDPSEAEPFHLLFRLLGGMCAEIVHEQTDFGIRIGRSDAGEIHLELVHVHRLLEDLIVLETILLGDPGQ